MNSLPNEILSDILGMLSIQDLLTSALVSKLWNDKSSNHIYRRPTIQTTERWLKFAHNNSNLHKVRGLDFSSEINFNVAISVLFKCFSVINVTFDLQNIDCFYPGCKLNNLLMENHETSLTMIKTLKIKNFRLSDCPEFLKFPGFEKISELCMERCRLSRWKIKL
jgi:hypothetical protein